MALEQLSLGTGPVDGGADGRQPSGDGGGGGGGDEGTKTARLPRWTRQEILVLIQGKRVAENRVRRGRASGSAFGSGHIEPKWASISSYCKRHGVNRGPVQCRKRWSNLAGDFKKIKEWESRIKEETESFWVMRNDLRRERKLPGFFDREVYDILDGGVGVVGGAGGGGEDLEMGGELSLALAPAATVGEEGDQEALFDSGRSTTADDGLFSDFEQSEAIRSPDRRKETPVKDIPAPTPISVAEKKRYQLFHEESPGQGINNEKQPESEEAAAQQGRKRKRRETDVDEGETNTNTNTNTQNIEHKLVEALEKNGKLLSSQIEAQNSNLQLDREQRNEHVNSLITVLNKLADAFGRIADKL